MRAIGLWLGWATKNTTRASSWAHPIIASAVIFSAIAWTNIRSESMPAARLDGFNVIATSTDPFGSAAADQSLTKAKEIGASAVAVIPFFWQPSAASPDLARGNDMNDDELRAAIREAHAQRMKLTGHLCSVTWPEAIELGIDDLEHGPVFSDTEFVDGKKPDVCPAKADDTWLKQDVHGPRVQQLIQSLVSHHVAVTSTLPVFDALMPGRPKLQQRTLDAMSAEFAQSYLAMRARIPLDSPMTALVRKEMDFEVAFVKAGGLLLTGPISFSASES